MPPTLSDEEILKDLEFIDDTGKGNHYALKWRRVGVGFIQPVRRPHKKLPPEVKKIYDQNAGKWHNTWAHQDYYDTKEAAAIQTVRWYLKDNAKVEITKALLARDYDFIDRWLGALAEKFRI